MLSEQELSLGISKLRKDIKSKLAYSEFTQFGMDLDHENTDGKVYCDKNEFDCTEQDIQDIQLEFIKYVDMFLKEFRPNQYRIVMENNCVKVERR